MDDLARRMPYELRQRWHTYYQRKAQREQLEAIKARQQAKATRG